jgi:predicted ATP-grasp superfamily ATP-dependent carboligase
MSHLQMEESPSLRSPILVAAFAGWNDAAQAASSSVLYLINGWSARRFAQIDPEEFYDFTDVRPMIRLSPSLQRELEWPSNSFYYHLDHTLSRDVVLLLGIEPHLKWRTFTESVLELVRQYSVSTLVTLGALLADAVHTRPVPLTGYSMDPDLAARLASMHIAGTRYQGPTGIVGTLHDACRRSGLSAASIWASVPYYLGTTPNPKASHALLSTLSGLVDLQLDLAPLEEQVHAFEQQVSEAVAANPDVAAHISELEQRMDAAVVEGPGEAETGELPGSDLIIKDLEEFLRSQREDGESE